jgi:transposase
MATGRMNKHRYSNEFKITAIKLAGYPGMLTQGVAAVLDIHPFMLSRWKKEYREGKIKGSAHPDVQKIKEVEEAVTEKTRIRELEAALKKAHIENDLLKKAIRFNLERSRTSSPLLTGISKNTGSNSSVITIAYPKAATMHGKDDR